ncbi:MAG: hypothetical protein ACTSR1_00235 [Candidatus Heimdallarchaeota archaeon]
MSYIPVITEDQDALQYGTPTMPVPNKADILKSEVENGLTSLPFSWGLSHLTNIMNHHYKVGRFLTPDDIKLEYPNVSFKNGEYESVVRQDSHEKAIKDFNDSVLENSAHTFGAEGTKFTGWLLSTALSPIGAIIGLPAERFVGRLGSSLMGKLSESSTLSRVLTKGAIGGLEGGVVTTPFSVANYMQAKDLQEPYSDLDALENFGLGSLFGGALRTVFGFRNVIDRDTNDAALKTAYDQMNAGKKVDINPIVKNGVINNIKNDGISLEDAQNAHASLDDAIGRFESEMPETKSNLFEKNQIGNPTEQSAFLESLDHENKDDYIENIRKNEKYSNISDDRLSQLYDLKNSKESIDYERKINNYNHVKSIRDDMSPYVTAKESELKPTTSSELINKVNYINSWKGESSTDINDYLESEENKRILSDETKNPNKKRDNDIKNYTDFINEIMESPDTDKELKSEFKDTIEKLGNEDKNIKLKHDSLKKAIRCIIGATEE